MDSLTLNRFAYTPLGTFGRLSLGDLFWYTVELPWKGNQPNVSCIPSGGYLIALGMFSDQYATYEVTHVPNRSAIKFHIANTVDDLRGCIGLGKGLGVVKGKWGVTGSRDAFEQFMAAMNGIPGAYLLIQSAPELTFV